MSERPILFSGPMVKAILEGRKTQTRRVLRFQPRVCTHSELESGDVIMQGGQPYRVWESRGRNERASGNLRGSPFKCPYGKPGDRLWVRERFRENKLISAFAAMHGSDYRCVVYKADIEEDEGPLYPYKPSIHMPRWASRLTLEITEVRVQRLQEITAEDAEAEGPFPTWWLPDPTGQGNHKPDWVPSFADLWMDINGPDSWTANPWVWAITFKPDATPAQDGSL